MNKVQMIVANNSGCCSKSFNCFLQKLNLPEAAQIVYLCRQELRNTESKKDLRDKLRDKLNQCVDDIHKDSKYFRMKYKITTETKTTISMKHTVCRWTFMEAWGFNESIRKVLCADIKEGRLKTAHAFTDRYSAADFDGDIGKLVVSCSLSSVITNPERLTIALIPNTEASFHCHNWLENYFNLCADDQPNSNEKHLDPVHK